MAVPDLEDLTIPIGLIRPSWSTDMGPAWLKLDGATEYEKARYPDFWAMFSGNAGVLAASKKTHFKLVAIEEGDALVSTGFKSAAGRIIGAKEVTLTLDQVPEHDHAYTDATAEPATQKGGLLTGLLTIMSGLTPKTNQGRTGKAGAASPKPVPIRPRGMTVNLFIHAGRPRH